jgi:hypothetical protein
MPACKACKTCKSPRRVASMYSLDSVPRYSPSAKQRGLIATADAYVVMLSVGGRPSATATASLRVPFLGLGHAWAPRLTDGQAQGLGFLCERIARAAGCSSADRRNRDTGWPRKMAAGAASESVCLRVCSLSPLCPSFCESVRLPVCLSAHLSAPFY